VADPGTTGSTPFDIYDFSKGNDARYATRCVNAAGQNRADVALQGPKQATGTGTGTNTSGNITRNTGAGGTTTYTDTRTGQLISNPTIQTSGEMLIVSGPNNAIGYFDATTGIGLTVTTTTTSGGVTVIVGPNGQVVLIDTATGRILTGTPTSTANQVSVTSSGGGVVVVDTRTGRVISSTPPGGAGGTGTGGTGTGTQGQDSCCGSTPADAFANKSQCRPRIVTTKVNDPVRCAPNPSTGTKHSCCTPGREALTVCAPYWKTEYAWRQGQAPQGCTVSPFVDMDASFQEEMPRPAPSFVSQDMGLDFMMRKKRMGP
jgi:hypothetical protein